MSSEQTEFRNSSHETRRSSDAEVSDMRKVRNASRAFNLAGLGIADRRLLLRRAMRRRELMRFSGLRLACLIIDYGVMLDEDSDPIEVILDYEFRNRSKHSA
ncbi:hypothetical protein [Lignipirellula cremea]|uniref:Uncharacterized protein n=1 Tax=Lignipirellula cremea TaxID=2528010 RepID=A0A518DXM7_9BACT|nr:hypothetical protein [Lignipirellula cremea]QDU96582.1 hypothetical protein Pla8534_44030 [Lignipirellula cremea]